MSDLTPAAQQLLTAAQHGWVRPSTILWQHHLARVVMAITELQSARLIEVQHEPLMVRALRVSDGGEGTRS